MTKRPLVALFAIVLFVLPIPAVAASSSTSALAAAGSSSVADSDKEAVVTPGLQFKDGDLLYLKSNGKRDTSLTGFAIYKDSWYYVTRGKVTRNNNGVIRGTVKKADA